MEGNRLPLAGGAAGWPDPTMAGLTANLAARVVSRGMRIASHCFTCLARSSCNHLTGYALWDGVRVNQKRPKQLLRPHAWHHSRASCKSISVPFGSVRMAVLYFLLCRGADPDHGHIEIQSLPGQRMIAVYRHLVTLD